MATPILMQRRLLKAIEEAEDELLAQKANERIDNMEVKDLISFEEATRLAGWR